MGPPECSSSTVSSSSFVPHTLSKESRKRPHEIEDESAFAKIPLELLERILLQTTTRSMRVCKHWKSIIENRPDKMNAYRVDYINLYWHINYVKLGIKAPKKKEIKVFTTTENIFRKIWMLIPDYLTFYGMPESHLNSYIMQLPNWWLEDVKYLSVCFSEMNTNFLSITKNFPNLHSLSITLENPNIVNDLVGTELLQQLKTVQRIQLTGYHHENDATLDLLSEKSLLSNGLEEIQMQNSTFTVEGLLRFLKFTRFSENCEIQIGTLQGSRSTFDEFMNDPSVTKYQQCSASHTFRFAYKGITFNLSLETFRN